MIVLLLSKSSVAVFLLFKPVKSFLLLSLVCLIFQNHVLLEFYLLGLSCW